jgi:hypothetical protein
MQGHGQPKAAQSKAARAKAPRKGGSAPLALSRLGPLAQPSLASTVMAIDVVFRFLCEIVPLYAIVRLCRACRGMAEALGRHSAFAFSAAPARALAVRGMREVLEVRWRRLGTAASAAENDAAYVGACSGGHCGLAVWLLGRRTSPLRPVTAGEAFAGACGGNHLAAARMAAAHPGAAPPREAVDRAIVQLVYNGTPDHEFVHWVLSVCPAPPSAAAAAEAFAAFCGQGKLGLAQLAYKAAAACLRLDEKQDLLVAALAASEGPSNGHVLDWLYEQLRVLQQLQAHRDEQRVRDARRAAARAGPDAIPVEIAGGAVSPPAAVPPAAAPPAGGPWWENDPHWGADPPWGADPYDGESPWQELDLWFGAEKGPGSHAPDLPGPGV